MSLIRLLSLSVVWEEKMLTRLPPFLRPVDLESFYSPWFTDRGESSRLNYITIWRYRTGTAKTAKTLGSLRKHQVRRRALFIRRSTTASYGHVAGRRIDFTLQAEESISRCRAKDQCQGKAKVQSLSHNRHDVIRPLYRQSVLN
jgi:hypothetical protein